MAKKVVGIVERVKIIGEKTINVFALFDTGAARTSVDTRLAERARLGSPIKTTMVRHASMKNEIKRPVVKAKVKIKGNDFNVKASLQDRAHMTFAVIIGRDILAGNFIVDPNKNKELFRKKRRKADQSNLMKYVS